MRNRNKSSNLHLRFYSAVVIGLTFIIAITGPIWFFNSIIVLIAGAMFYEWFNITRSNIFHLLIGFLVITFAICSLLIIKFISNYILLWYFVLIWSVDCFAMIGGKSIGGPRLAPHISPNKTWSGLLSGVLSALVVVHILNLYLNMETDFTGIMSTLGIYWGTLLISILAQLSDLFESYFKRYHQVKDSGTIIPGHGGVLDRFDSILLSAPTVLLCLVLKY